MERRFPPSIVFTESTKVQTSEVSSLPLVLSSFSLFRRYLFTKKLHLFRVNGEGMASSLGNRGLALVKRTFQPFHTTQPPPFFPLIFASIAAFERKNNFSVYSNDVHIYRVIFFRSEENNRKNTSRSDD